MYKPNILIEVCNEDGLGYISADKIKNSLQGRERTLVKSLKCTIRHLIR